jgi:uncharacterized membrane protein
MQYDEERLDALERTVGELKQRISAIEGVTARSPLATPQSPPDVSIAPPKKPEPPAEAVTGWSSIPSVASSVPAQPASAPAPKRPRERIDLESLLSGKVLAWTGGLAVFAGLLFFLATALNRGWIDEPTRVVLAFVAATGLLAVGLFLHERKDQTQASVAMVATAIAGLFAATTAATILYDLIRPEPGLMVAGLIGVVAAAIAIRWESKEIATIGIVGALLSPVLVGSGTSDASLAFMLVALLSATAVLLWMSWDGLAVAAFATSTPQLALWLIDADDTVLAGQLTVLALFWAVYAVAAVGYELRVPTAILRPTSATLLLADALLVSGAGWALLSDAGRDNGATIWIICVAATHIALGAYTFRGRVSREVSLLLIAVGLGLSAIGFAMALDGPALVAAWSVEAVLLAWLAQRMELARGYLGAAGFLIAATVHVLAFDAPLDALASDWDLSAVVAVALVGAAAAAVSALYDGDEDAYREAALALALAALAYLPAVALDGVAVVVAWAAICAAMVELTGRKLVDLRGVAPLPFLALAAGHTIGLEAPPSGLIDGVADLGSALLAIAATAGAALYAANRFPQLREPLTAFAAICLVYLGSIAIVDLTAGSAGNPGQSSQVLLSVFWASVGFGGLLFGLLRGERRARLGGLALLAIAALKVTLYDLSELDEIYRVLSFIGLGLLLLAGAYADQRIRQEIESEQ